MESNNIQPQPANADQEIDLMELVQKLWQERRTIVRWCAVGALVGVIVAFSIPKEYTVSVKLAPEVTDGKRASGNLGTLASMAGISLGSSGSADAVYPKLYPDIVSSVPFTTELFGVKVADRKGKYEIRTYDYVLKKLRAPWWNAVVSAPFKALSWFVGLFRTDEKPAGTGAVDTFRLTKNESKAVRALNERIGCTVDKKSSVITLSVTMQDPLIAATLTDTVMRNLQNYITEYRTTKARNDLAFTQKLFNEARAEYYRAQSKYARYLDANQNVVLRSVRTEQERLQNEMTLAYNVYTQTAQQLQLARAKVQESTPVYAVLQPATVPLNASKPSKMMIFVGCVCLAGAISAGWILIGRDLVGAFRKESGNCGK